MKSKHHEITLSDLQDWMSNVEMLYSASSRELKRLYCNANGTFKVKVNGKVIWEGSDAQLAVDTYNSITEAYQTPNP